MKKITLVLTLLFTFVVTPVWAVSIQVVTGPKSGVTAWLVEDHKLPLIAMRFAFEGGSEQDPVQKQGLATLTMDALTEGAGRYSSNAFQQVLANNSITLDFKSDRDELVGGVKSLSTDKQKAFELLHLALTKPRFESADIERLRAAQAAAIRQQFANPSWQARYALLSHIYAGHPYDQRRLGSLETLKSITAQDVKDFAAHHMARDTLTIAVAGDITPPELAADLDSVFGDLPAHAQLAPIAEAAEINDTPTIVVTRQGTQTDMMFALSGPKRNDPEWYAADIANYILGGGGFSSRLMQEVRDKKGLTYGISTSLSPSEHSGLLVGHAAVDNPKASEALETIRTTMRKFHEDGPTTAEVAAAKDFLTGSQPLALTSTDKIASVLVYIQREKLGRDYLDRYGDMIRSVSPKEINRAIDRWFNPDKAVWIMVGKPEGLAATQTKETVKQ